MAAELKVYDLSKIVANDGSEEDASRVARAIMATVEPQSWSVLGGEGRIAAVKPTLDKVWRLAVLSAHQPAVKKLLDDLRP